MKNYRFLIVFIAMVALFWSATSKTARADFTDVPFLTTISAATTAAEATNGFTASVQAWYKVYTTARDLINDQVRDFQANLNKQLSSNMVDQKKNQDAWEKQHAAAHGLTNDYSNQQLVSQEAIRAAAQKNGEALFAALQRNKPSREECITITARMIREYDLKYSRQAVITTANADPLLTGNYQLPATVSNTIATNYATAMSKTGCDPHGIDVGTLKNQCTTPDAFNAALKNRFQDILQKSAGAKLPPIPNPISPAFQKFISERADWVYKHSTARATVEDFLPKYLKSANSYNQANNEYQTAYGLSPTDAQAKLESEFPNAHAVGLSAYELDVAHRNALRANGSSSGAGGGASESQTHTSPLEAAERIVEADNHEQERYKAAMEDLAIPAPILPGNAIQNK